MSQFGEYLSNCVPAVLRVSGRPARDQPEGNREQLAQGRWRRHSAHHHHPLVFVKGCLVAGEMVGIGVRRYTTQQDGRYRTNIRHWSAGT
jgi:hypothetical protein